MIIMSAYVVWHLWKERNRRGFDKKEASSDEAVSLIRADLQSQMVVFREFFFENGLSGSSCLSGCFLSFSFHPSCFQLVKISHFFNEKAELLPLSVKEKGTIDILMQTK